MLLRSRSLNIPENLNNVKSFDPTEFVLDWNRFDAVIGQEPAPKKRKEKIDKYKIFRPTLRSLYSKKIFISEYLR